MTQDYSFDSVRRRSLAQQQRKNDMSQDMNALIAAVKATIPEDRGAQAEIAERLGVAEPFVSKCVKRGWFPIDRAKALADLYSLEFLTLIKPDLRRHFDVSN